MDYLIILCLQLAFILIYIFKFEGCEFRVGMGDNYQEVMNFLSGV